MNSMQLVCSNQPRPSVQKGAKGNQFWRRDVHHIQSVGKLTLCGIDAAEWLIIGPYISVADDNQHLCKRCASALSRPTRGVVE